jgi:hypothetical protein
LDCEDYREKLEERNLEASNEGRRTKFQGRNKCRSLVVVQFTRMRRRLLRLISWVSLALSVASVAGWIRSCVREDMISVEKTYQHFIASRRGSIAVGDGGLSVGGGDGVDVRYFPFSDHFQVSWTNQAISLDPDYGEKHLGWNDWYWNAYHDSPVFQNGREFIVHYWMLSTVFVITPLVGVFRWLFYRRRYATGCCRQCGYDLRATPSCCPECGSVPAE